MVEWNGAGAVQNWYAFGLGPDEVLNRMNGAGTTRATLIPDVQGSIIASLDAASGTLTKFGYQTFGENPTATAATPSGFYYTARRLDPETAGSTAQPSGLYYYRARMYSPGWGRFPQTDPSGYQGGANLYAYVGNDLLNLLDPSGLAPDNPQANAATQTTNATALVLPAAGGLAAGGGEGTIATGLGGVSLPATALAAGLLVLTTTSTSATDTCGAGGCRQSGVNTTASSVPHGNSAASMQGTEVYYLINNTSGEIDKIGITSNPSERYSDAYLRAENVTYVPQAQYVWRYPAMVDEKYSPCLVSDSKWGSATS